MVSINKIWSIRLSIVSILWAGSPDRVISYCWFVKRGTGRGMSGFEHWGYECIHVSISSGNHFQCWFALSLGSSVAEVGTLSLLY